MMFACDMSFNLPVLQSSFELQVFNEPKHLRPETVSLLSDEIIEFFLSKDIVVGSELFFVPPFINSTIHADEVGDIIKFNWIFGGKDSVMQWWQPKVEKPVVYTEHKSPTIRYTRNEVDLVHSATVKQPSMVQVGIPHNVKNKTENRWCVSVIPLFKTTRKRLTWADGIGLFSDYIIQA
jgi:hypothetical protein